ncbi:oxidoreductase [Dysgonomonas sp. Marseille-P4677]|uniref:putative oxidoreductase C-terminal domain-containing protein n=1 Tax=Dysgonomonas sp. Marseille-P4677 TaxID=2364790 RepID=UPI001913B3EA|nr:putative oxidoreductase C-terminal domain-containing protein [Dysgonomonas sp. Marseille-P4677]MBK5720992.1 oxidoreductase [Dysgonomonas sp. Marseille-P4677]
MKYLRYPFCFFAVLVLITACNMQSGNKKFDGSEGEVRLITVAPGHFHAALLQKTMLKQLNYNVQVYAPNGPELDNYLALIDSYNNRENNPTYWNPKVYTGSDFLERMLSDKNGNVVVLAGNNQLKTDYILRSVGAGLNVLADKPMAIDKASFEQLKSAFILSAKNDVLLYDIMTERYSFINILSRVLMQDKAFFGTLTTGTSQSPAVEMESVHHFYKIVSGNPLSRPAWYYDVEQQGEGIVDVTTHLIDLINWKCFPEISLDYKKDIKVTSARHWATPISPEQFRRSTKITEYPEYLNKYVKDSTLYVYANGEIGYQVKGVNVGIKVIWNYEAPEGTGDTHRTVINGTKAIILVLQGEEQGYKSKLYVKKGAEASEDEFRKNITKVIDELKNIYPVSLKDAYDGMLEIEISPSMDDGHEAHFSKVAEKYFNFLITREMPEWEVPNMLVKYYITTTALELARKETPIF